MGNHGRLFHGSAVVNPYLLLEVPFIDHRGATRNYLAVVFVLKALLNMSLHELAVSMRFGL